MPPLDWLSGRQQRMAAVATILSVATVGFFVGLRPSATRSEYRSSKLESGAMAAPAARTNAELALRPWSTELPRWSPDKGPAPEPVTTKNTAALKTALEKRARHRAFEGAPPTIPHPQGSARECLACHRWGARIGAAFAPVMSHEPYPMCTQCHVPESPAFAEAEWEGGFASAGSDFAGRRGAAAPLVALPGAPPQQPHTTHMREHCQSCHGPFGRPGLQTSHPERAACQQCHAPSALADQRGLP